MNSHCAAPARVNGPGPKLLPGKIFAGIRLLGCCALLSACAETSGNRADTANLAGKSVASADSANLARAAAPFTSSATPGNTAYKIGPLDVLDITVFRVPELTRSVQVADTGSINMPLIGDVQTAGRTAQEVERDLTSRLGAKFLQSPQVTVYVKEYNSQRVTIDGAVKKPGVYPLRGKTSLLQFIALAEGLDRDTASSSVVVFRQGGDRRLAARFDMDAIRSGQSEDPVIQQGDVIVVDTSSSKLAFSYFVKALPITSVFTTVAAL